MLAGFALLAPLAARAAPPETIVAGDTAAAGTPSSGGPRFHQDGDVGSWVTASTGMFERGRAFGLTSPATGKAFDGLLHPYVRKAPSLGGMHRQLEAGIALPLADDLSLATAYGKVRLRSAMPSTWAVKTGFAKVGLKLAF